MQRDSVPQVGQVNVEKENGMRVKKLLHTRMRVSDMEQTLGFYREVLGLEVVEQRCCHEVRIWRFWLSPIVRN